jgi:hypothetical protein
MSDQEINKLVSDLNSAEREYDILEQDFDRRKQILVSEAKGPISKERAAQLLTEMGNLNYQRTIEMDSKSRKIEEIRVALKQMFQEKNKKIH